MNLPNVDSEQFEALVRENQFKKAFQSIMGVGDKPVLYGRALIQQVGSLHPEDRERLHAWCISPMEAQPIGELRWYVEQIARHELGHAVAAKLLGFKVNGITLQLTAANGDHVATTSLDLSTRSTNIADAMNYVEKRVIILMSGAMAEGESVAHLMNTFYPAFDDASFDRQKCDELLQLYLNVKNTEAGTRSSDYPSHLISATHNLVRANHAAIVRMATKMAELLQDFGQKVIWSGEQVGEMFAVEGIKSPQ